MSKPVKKMIERELASRFEGLSSLAICDMTGLDAITTNNIRGRLRDKEIQVTVVKNSMARAACRDVGLEEACDLFEGPCAIAYGSEGVVTVVRELLDIRKQAPALTVKAAILEGDVFGADRIEELSNYPTREEAIARVVRMVLTPGANVAGAAMGPGGKVAALLKAIEEKHGGEADEQAA